MKNIPKYYVKKMINKLIEKIDSTHAATNETEFYEFSSDITIFGRFIQNHPGNRGMEMEIQ